MYIWWQEPCGNVLIKIFLYLKWPFFILLNCHLTQISCKWILLSHVEVCEVVATNEDVNDPNRCFEMPRNVSGGINVFSVHAQPECLQSSPVVLLVDLGGSASGHLCQDLYWMLFYNVKECLGSKTCDVINPASRYNCRVSIPVSVRTTKWM